MAAGPPRGKRRRLPLLPLLPLLLAAPGGSGEERSAEGGACQRLFAGGAAARWRRIAGPLDGELLVQAAGQAFEVALEGDAAELPRGAAAVLLLDGALVAYGGGWEAEDTLLLPALGSGAHTVSLGVVSDTGGATWKRDTDLCAVHTVSFAVQAEDASAAPPEAAGAVGAILWPRTGARLLASETHVLRFTLREARDISIDCNGVRVREVSPYDAGQHDTALDFVAQCRGLGGGRGDSAAAARELTINLVVWEDEPGDATAERMEQEQHQLVVRAVEEPPNMLIQFPPDGYVFDDAANVNVAALVPYFAFHRFPHVLGGGGGFLQVRVDSLDAVSAPVQRDGEGVFELTMTFGPPYTEAGWHDMQLVLLDAGRHPISGLVELQYYVSGGKGGGASLPGGAAHPTGPDAQARADEADSLQLPLGRWALFDSASGTCSRAAPPAAQSPASLDADESGCSGHGKCVALPGLAPGKDGGGAGVEWPGGGSVGEGGAGACGCLCSGDWIGERCHVDLATAEEFMPHVMPALDPARRVLSASFVNGSQQLLQRLARMHVRANCHRDRALAFDYNDQGLAAVVSDASVQLTWALRQGKAATFRGMWLYGSHRACAHAPGVACHFRPHFDCPEDVEVPERDFEAHPREVIPDEFARRGAFWWYAHVTHYLLEENLEFRLKLAAAKAALGFQRPIIGVHVRNGDYCSFENDQGGLCLMYRHCICDGFEPYLERIRKMQAQYNISTVFLATQDARILLAAQAQPELRVIALPFDRDQLTGKAAKKALHWRQRQGYVDSELVSESALLDLFLLAECDVLVGAFHSQYSRLAYQLMAMRQGLHPPFSSVHPAWGTTLTYPL